MLSRWPAWLLVCLLFAIPACGGGGSTPGAADGQAPLTPAPPPAVADPTRTLLSTCLPATAQLAPGAQFVFTLNLDCAAPVYQGSGRVLYDAACLEPVAAEPGAALPAGGILSVKLDAPALAEAPAGGLAGVVPYAFTGLPGSGALAAAHGELLRITFRVKRSGLAAAPVRLWDDAAYLQLRGPDGARVAFDLHSAAGAP